MVFHSGRQGANALGGYDLWETRRPSIDAPFEAPVSLGALVNSPQNDADPVLSADGRTLWFASDRPDEKSYQWDLWVTRRDSIDAPWKPPELLDEVINGLGTEFRPCLSADEQVLVFHCPNRLGGRGWDDLWISERRSKTDPFPDAENMGALINTTRHDDGGCLSPDGLQLLFVRDRKELLLARRPDRNSIFQAPEPLNGPFGPMIHVWHVPARESVIAASSRQGGIGSLDLWESRRVPKGSAASR
jgi:hypothetical protein